MSEKLCPRCGEIKPISDFHRGQTRPADMCKSCKREYNYERKYGCMPSGLCEICGEREANRVDHDHACCPREATRTCGRCVRGFLCNDCNSGLGMFHDEASWLRSAAAYLDRVGLGGANVVEMGPSATVTVSERQIGYSHEGEVWSA